MLNHFLMKPAPEDSRVRFRSIEWGWFPNLGKLHPHVSARVNDHQRETLDGTPVSFVRIGWFSVDWNRSVFPLMAFAALALFAVFMVWSGWTGEGLPGWLLGELWMPAFLLVLAGMVWAVRHVYFWTSVYLQFSYWRSHPPADLAEGQSVDKWIDEQRMAITGTNSSAIDWVRVSMRPGAAARIDKAARLGMNEATQAMQVRDGEIGALLAQGASTNYNPRDVSIVQVDRAGIWRNWAYAGLALVFVFMPYLVGGLLFAVGMIDALTGYPDLLTAIVALGGIWVGIGVFGLALVALYKSFRLLLGMPFHDAFRDMEMWRLRIRSKSGNWTTLLHTHSEVLATEAYNLVSADVHRTGE